METPSDGLLVHTAFTVFVFTFVLVRSSTSSPTVTLTGSLDNNDSFTPTDPVRQVDKITGSTRSANKQIAFGG